MIPELHVSQAVGRVSASSPCDRSKGNHLLHTNARARSGGEGEIIQLYCGRGIEPSLGPEFERVGVDFGAAVVCISLHTDDGARGYEGTFDGQAAIGSESF